MDVLTWPNKSTHIIQEWDGLVERRKPILCTTVSAQFLCRIRSCAYYVYAQREQFAIILMLYLAECFHFLTR